MILPCKTNFPTNLIYLQMLLKLHNLIHHQHDIVCKSATISFCCPHLQVFCRFLHWKRISGSNLYHASTVFNSCWSMSLHIYLVQYISVTRLSISFSTQLQHCSAWTHDQQICSSLDGSFGDTFPYLGRKSASFLKKTVKLFKLLVFSSRQFLHHCLHLFNFTKWTIFSTVY